MKNPFKIVNDKGWYPCKCTVCGWTGSSSCVDVDSYSDDTDLYCPRCGSMAIEEYGDFYPIYYPITNLISCYKAWQIRREEDKHWREVSEELK